MTRITTKRWTCTVAVFTAMLFLQSAHARPMTPHDLMAMQQISDPQLAPDGRSLVFVVKTNDLDDNRGRTDLWLIDTDGTDPRRLTTHPENDSNPRWSPDGRWIYFVSARTGSSQVFRIRPDGGEAEPVTQLPLDVANLVVGPDGWLAFTMEVFPNTTPQQTKDRLDEIEQRKASGRIYDHIFVRHWNTWKDGRRSHVFIARLDTDLPITADACTDVMPDMDADCPSKPFGGPEEIAFAPDASALVFTARDAGRAEPWSTNFDLYRVPLDGLRGNATDNSTPKRTNLTADNPAWDTQPLFSPDGRTLAYLAMRRPGYESDRFRIVLRDVASGRTRVLTEDWDRSPGAMAWSPDGRTLYVTAMNLGQRSLFAVDTRSGRVRTLVRDGRVSSPQAARDRVFFGLCHLKSPVELHAVYTNGSGLKRLTRLNDRLLAQLDLGDYEQFTFRGWNDQTVYAYLVKPPRFNPAARYPLVYLIHGGPQGSFSNTWHYRWNPQVITAAGYAAVMVDFHGSVGYGQDFCDSIRGDWGGKPLEDLRKGLAAALDLYPWLDGDRVGAMGGSFGGYMVNWIAGQWPDRFRCLVTHAGNLDERMAYFDTEELWFPEWDHMGTPWTNPQSYEKHNPVNYVKNWKTPMLVIHGAKDFRVVDTQGLSTFNACQRLGIPSKLLYYPDEGHWILKPHNAIQWQQTVIAWLDQWLK